jgi:regulator of cell morphogenesis and NO signaling
MAARLIAHLLDDHREVEQIFADLAALLDRIQAEPGWSSAQAGEFRRLASNFDHCVKLHMEKEGRVLYPALEDFLPRDTGPLAVLRGEQRDLLGCLGEWHRAGELLAQGNMQPAVREAFVRAGRDAIRIERNHFYKEERVPFPMAARLLSAERDAHLREQAAAIQLDS